MGACGSKGAAIASTVSLDSIQRVDSIVPSSGRIRTNSEMDRLKRRAVLDQMRKDNEIFTPEVRRVGGNGGEVEKEVYATVLFHVSDILPRHDVPNLFYFVSMSCPPTDFLISRLSLTPPPHPSFCNPQDCAAVPISRKHDRGGPGSMVRPL